MNAERESETTLIGRIDWRRLRPWLLGLALASTVVLGPFWLFACVGGFLLSYCVPFLSFLPMLTALGVLFCWTLVRAARHGLARRGREAASWFSVVLAIVLTVVLFRLGKTPSANELFGRGVVARLEIGTDIEAVRAWLTSLGPNECLPVPHVNPRGRYLSEEELPAVLRPPRAMVQLELDTEGRPSVRLEWLESKFGTWGLVIGDKAMPTPPSEPGMYGEKRTPLYPGLYFWYKES